MSDPRTLAAAYGLAVEVTDLGDWEMATLISEYDPAARTIRVNERALDAYRRSRGGLDSCDVRAFIDFAVAHELYHHREAAGEIVRLETRDQREEAADAYARASVRVDSGLDAYLQTLALR